MRRIVLQLAYFDDYTQREIAALLGLPLGTVKTPTPRGMVDLVELLVTTDEAEVRITA